MPHSNSVVIYSMRYRNTNMQTCKQVYPRYDVADTTKLAEQLNFTHAYWLKAASPFLLLSRWKCVSMFQSQMFFSFALGTFAVAQGVL